MGKHSQQWRRSNGFLVCAALHILATLAPAQLYESELPNAPAPAIHLATGLTPPRSIPLKPGKHRWLNANRTSLGILVAGEALDSWTTYANLTHHKWICGSSPAFGDAVTYISNDGKRYDPQTIRYSLCGPGPSGQSANYAYDVTRTGAYTETGWVTTLRLTANRNVAGVLAWNIADDVGYVLVAHHLGKRRGLVGRIAPAINIARGLVHFDCGIQNLQFAHAHADAGKWQFNVPHEATLYPGPRWWGRQ